MGGVTVRDVEVSLFYEFGRSVLSGLSGVVYLVWCGQARRKAIGQVGSEIKSTVSQSGGSLNDREE